MGTRTLRVENTGDRPIQVGSHYHFAETNPALSFDRDAALGYHLNIASGTAVRFEPGQGREVTLVEFAGKREIYGFRGDVMGQLPDAEGADDATVAATMDRTAYAQMFGPTVGDKVRLGDTDLWIQVEQDFTVYGDEVKFGGGKVIRDGMGQGQALNTPADGQPIDGCVMDLVITNAVVLDHWGVVKGDVGIKDGRIVKVGKAGNPDVQAGVDIIVGPGTEVIAGEGSIL